MPATASNTRHRPRTIVLRSAVTLNLEAPGGGRPKFSTVAYNGTPVEIDGFDLPLVIDCATLESARFVTALFNHDRSQIIGQSTGVDITANSVVVEGLITGDEGAARDVITHAKNGFRWPVSVGVRVLSPPLLVRAGEKVVVNGRTFDGPLYVTRKAMLRELSFLAIGADADAYADVEARERDAQEIEMSFSEWLTAKSFDEASLSEPQKASLQAMYDAEKPEDKGDAKAGEKTPAVRLAAPTPPAPDVTAAGVVADIRAAAKAESDRIGGIRKVCEAAPEIEAKAIAEGWTVEKAELTALREGRPSAPTLLLRRPADVNARVVECAIRLGSAEQTSRVEADYDEKTLDAASKHRRLSLRGLISLGCAMDGRPCPSINDDRDTWVRAAFSTASVPGILAATANKLLLSAFQAVPQMARKLFRKLTANDFKAHTGYRLGGGDGTLPKVGSGGELKPMKLDETSFSYQVDTYGGIIGITRQQWTNDDLGAFTQIPLHIGRGAANAVESAAWTLVLANTGTFFGTSNANYIEGADTVLGISGLDQLVKVMREALDSASQPINVSPKYLVVPPTLEGEARRLYVSDYAIATGAITSASKIAAGANHYKGMFEPVVVPHLRSATTAWYLFGDPADVAAFGIGYLNGVEEPTVEEVDAAPNFLGRTWRGYLDFGVCQVEKQGAAKSKGAA